MHSALSVDCTCVISAGIVLYCIVLYCIVLYCKNINMVYALLTLQLFILFVWEFQQHQSCFYFQPLKVKIQTPLFRSSTDKYGNIKTSNLFTSHWRVQADLNRSIQIQIVYVYGSTLVRFSFTTGQFLHVYTLQRNLFFQFNIWLGFQPLCCLPRGLWLGLIIAEIGGYFEHHFD